MTPPWIDRVTDEWLEESEKQYAGPAFIADAIMRHMPRLRWTTEKPTVPGRYWWRLNPNSKVKAQILMIMQGYKELEVRPGGVLVMEIEGQFAGPIPEPEE